MRERTINHHRSLRWSLDQTTKVIYHLANENISFCESSNFFPPRRTLTISWEQFINLKDLLEIIDHESTTSTRHWHVGNRLWLSLPRNAVEWARLHIATARDHQTLCFQFDRHSWLYYKNFIQHCIYSSHRRRHTYSNARRHTNNRRIIDTHRQRNVRCQSTAPHRSRRHLSPSDNNELHLQTLQRPASNVAGLPSSVASEYSTLSMRQDTSNGTHYDFRRALNDLQHTSKSDPTVNSKVVIVNQLSSDDITQYGDVCSIGEPCEID